MRIPTLLTVLMVAVLLALGFWQLERRAWKAELIARLEANQASAPLALPATLLADQEFGRVQLDCAWRGEPLRLPGSGPAGKAGERVYRLCAPADGGAPVLVDQGFVALGAEVAPVPDGPVAAVLRHWPTLSFVERLSGARRVNAAFVGGDRDFFLQLAAPATPDGPVPAPLNARDLPDNHLSYAIQWFSFAAILLAIYGAYALRWRRRLNRRA